MGRIVVWILGRGIGTTVAKAGLAALAFGTACFFAGRKSK